jgi:hypothetical protein
MREHTGELMVVEEIPVFRDNTFLIVQQDHSRRWYEYAYLKGVYHIQHLQENIKS